MDRGAWWATVHGMAKSQTRLKRLCTHAMPQPPEKAWRAKCALCGQAQQEIVNSAGQ